MGVMLLVRRFVVLVQGKYVLLNSDCMVDAKEEVGVRFGGNQTVLAELRRSIAAIEKEDVVSAWMDKA
jgi:hypothetical protein